MSPKVFWIDAPDVGRLAVVSRPDPALGLPQQMQALRDAGIDTLVSLLAPDEAAAMGLAGEGEAATAAGIVFDALPTADFAIPPSFKAAARVIGRAAGDLRAGRSVGAHCFAGRGRSPLFIAALMVHEGYTASDAIDAVSAARGRRVPETAAQHQWVADYAEWCRANC
jgi:protein-tyrosine phosphatase